MDIYARPLAPHSGGDAMEVERVDYADGIKVYLRGYVHPWKGIPSEAAVNAINIIKKLLLETLRLKVLILSPFKAYRAFEEIVEKVIGPHILKPKYQMPFTRELTLFLENAGMSHTMSQNLAHIFEYDSSYRFRLQDMLTQANRDALINTPREEIERLIQYNRTKDYLAVHKKISKLAKLLSYLLIIHSFRKKWKFALEKSTFTNFALDEDDNFWIGLRSDYGKGNLNPIL